MTHIVFFIGKLEVLDYFVKSMYENKDELLFDYYVADINNPETYSSDAFYSYIQQKNVIAILFNQVGLNLLIDGECVWKRYNIPVFDYIVDHPRNYSDTLLNPITDINAIVIDKSHEKFIREFYPKVKSIFFLPNGGTPTDYARPYAQRDIDVIYTGSLKTKVINFPIFTELGDKCQEFYNFTISLMLNYPDVATADAIEYYFKTNNYPDIDMDEYHNILLKLNLEAAPYIEIYVRREFQLRTILELDRAGICVELYGKNWDMEESRFSDNIHIHSWITSDECNQAVGRAKIALNCMPWYKEGCSERVFNNMLNGAVCVTDTSTYLTGRFNHGKELIFYNLDSLNEMAKVVKYLLDNTKVAEQIADRGRKAAIENDTWTKRLEKILEFANKI